MAIDYTAEYNAIEAMLPLLSKTTDFTLFSNALRPLITEAQTQGLAADATATAFLIANRAFVKNVGASPIVLTYNGYPFTFTNGKSYSCSPFELSFFINEAKQNGYGTSILNDPSGAVYFGGNGINQFFFF